MLLELERYKKDRAESHIIIAEGIYKFSHIWISNAI
jgi:hypothetical protein